MTLDAFPIDVLLVLIAFLYAGTASLLCVKPEQGVHPAAFLAAALLLANGLFFWHALSGCSLYSAVSPMTLLHSAALREVGTYVAFSLATAYTLGFTFISFLRRSSRAGVALSLATALFVCATFFYHASLVCSRPQALTETHQHE